jgi:pectinesterase
MRLIHLSILMLCFDSSFAAAGQVTVAADGSARFKTLQEAIAAISDNAAEPTIIHIKPGTYRGQMVLPKGKMNVFFQGEDAQKTILAFSYNANEVNPPEVQQQYKGTGVVILGDDFHASKITFQNTSGDHGQALALRIDGDRAVLVDCRLLGWQDTLMLNNGRQYFKNCYIEGRVDFIYGSGNAVFDQCEIHSKNGGHITAASTPENHPYGFVFLHCKLTGDAIPWSPPAGSPPPRVTPLADLGRPWRPYASVTFIDCEMGNHIKPQGWNNWGKAENEKTARYSEYGSTGPGANPAKRVSWSRQLTREEAEKITIESVLAGADGWKPQTVSATTQPAT